MGQLISNKMATPTDVEVASENEELVDVSRRVTDSKEDIDQDRYRIVLTCKKNNRVEKTDPVRIELSGEENSHLKVVVKNKIFYNSPLPKAATACDYKIEKAKGADLLYLMITKAEQGLWTTKSTT